MRTIMISCDRCGKEITGYPVKITPEHTGRKNDELQPDNGGKLPEWAEKILDKDFCVKCTEKIVRYALGGMKENPEFKKAVEEMVEGAAPPVRQEKENKAPDTDGDREGRTGRSKIDAGKVMALTKAGWSAPKIADEMGISVQAVYDARYRLKKEGNL
ncbi:MAG: helix-turn-helix domain-containing protein [Lachnospiraceae bacterium]|nr:helix-turn-helix domain-containing protein [Lachnospiraceae bacterium]